MIPQCITLAQRTLTEQRMIFYCIALPTTELVLSSNQNLSDPLKTGLAVIKSIGNSNKHGVAKLEKILLIPPNLGIAYPILFQFHSVPDHPKEQQPYTSQDRK